MMDDWIRQEEVCKRELSFREAMGVFCGGKSPKASSTSVIPPMIQYKTKMTTVMVSEFLVMDVAKLDPKKKQ